MKIFLDCTFLKSIHTGVELAFLSLIENILQQDAENEYTILIDTRYDTKELYEILKQFKNYKIKKLYAILPLQVFYASFLLPFYLRIKKYNVYHNLFFFGPIIKFVCPSTKIVITVYDMYHRTVPQKIGVYVKTMFTVFADAAIKKADAVIVISRQTQDDVLKYLNIPEKKVKLIYLALITSFNKNELSDNSLEKFGIEKNNYILTVSTVSPGKALEDLIRAFSILITKYNVHPGIKVVSAGKPIGNYVSELVALTKALRIPANSIKILGYVSESSLKELYANAKMFVLPSHYEGFGLTLLEAMKFQKPIIARKASSITEVLGNAGLLFESCEQMADQMHDLLVDDDMVRNLVEKGNLRLKDFSWVETAKQTLDIYKTSK